MPIYEYACRQCKAVYDIQATVEEKQAGLDVKCPKCGSTDMKQVFGGVMLHSSGAVQLRGGCNPESGCCGPRR